MTEPNSIPAGPVVMGHDGSHHADLALASAIRFAELFAAPLVIVRAWHLDADVPAYTRILAVDLSLPDLAVDIRASLVHDCAQQEAEHPGLAVGYRVQLGAAATVLSNLSEGARLLMVGSRGLGGLRGARSHRAAHATRPLDGGGGRPANRRAAAARSVRVVELPAAAIPRVRSVRGGLMRFQWAGSFAQRPTVS